MLKYSYKVFCSVRTYKVGGLSVTIKDKRGEALPTFISSGK